MLDVRSGVELLLKQVDGKYTYSLSKDISLLRITDEKRRKALIWLSNLEFENPHERARKSRFNDTGRWLFEKPEFVSWIESQGSSVLWLNGKGIATSIIILSEWDSNFYVI